MKQKYYDVHNLHVGFLGYVKCDEKGALWTKKENCPCIIYEEKVSETLDNAKEGYDIFSDNHYFFINSVSSSDKNGLEIINGKCVIGKGFPISVIIDKENVSLCDLKSIICNFNILDCMVKRKDDVNLKLLKKEIDMTDNINNNKDRERFIDSISFYTKEYIKTITRSDKSFLDIEDIEKQIEKMHNHLIDYVNKRKAKIKRK